MTANEPLYDSDRSKKLRRGSEFPYIMPQDVAPKSPIKELSLSQVLFVLRRWANRAQKTSIEHFADYLKGAEFIHMNGKLERPYRILKKIAQYANHDRYTSVSVGLEAACLGRLLRKPIRLVHFLYGEYDVHYAPYFCNLLRIPVVASFHNPPRELERRIAEPSFLRRFAGVIALGTNQVAYFQKHAPNVHCAVIPLGVDTEFFSPAEDQDRRGKSKIVFILGVHMRDWDLVHEFAYQLRQAVPDVEFQFAVPRSEEWCLPRESWVRNSHPLSDYELRDLYRRATFMFYAPADCVGSNAVVEALACGLPIIAPDVGAVKNYVTKGCGFVLDRRDIQGMVEAGVELIRDENLRMSTGMAGRKRSLEIDWVRIREQYFQFYKELGIDIA